MGNLRELFKEIWKINILDNYSKGKINIESGLQADLYHFLKNRLPDDFDVWVESTLYFDNECMINRSRPDILVSLNNEIQCIVEIK